MAREKGVGVTDATSPKRTGLGPLQQKTLHERAYSRIRSALASGQLGMGENVTLRALAEELGISETPVRDAVRRLITEGALEAVPNRSITVPVITRTKLRELRQVRVALEGLAAEMAVGNLSAEEIGRLSELNNELADAAESGDIATYQACNHDFHMSIYRASGSELLVDVIQLLWLRAGPLFPHLFDQPKVAQRTVRPHRKIVAALRAGDPEDVRAAIVSDITEAAKYFETILPETQDDD